VAAEEAAPDLAAVVRACPAEVETAARAALLGRRDRAFGNRAAAVVARAEVREALRDQAVLEVPVREPADLAAVAPARVELAREGPAQAGLAQADQDIRVAEQARVPEECFRLYRLPWPHSVALGPVQDAGRRHRRCCAPAATPARRSSPLPRKKSAPC